MYFSLLLLTLNVSQVGNLLYPLEQWYSTWAKSPSRGWFYASRGRFCDLPDLGSDFSFQGGDFCRL